mgnify:CR=1 FL=1|nr:MAG TPA_asm: Helix-turn-helix XRE-family like protein [Caudoviricetes sp.]
MNINKKITKYREKAGLNKSQLAREINVSPAYVTMLENGTKTPSSELVIRMAYVLNISPDKLDENIQLTEYTDLKNELETLINSPEWESEKGFLLSLRDRMFKNYYERGAYKTKLFNFYEEFGELTNKSVYYDELDKKVINVGLNNFKAILPEGDLSDLSKLVKIIKLLKTYINGHSENDPEVMSFAEKTINIDINDLEFLNIPKNKKLKIDIKLIDNLYNQNSIK